MAGLSRGLPGRSLMWVKVLDKDRLMLQGCYYNFINLMMINLKVLFTSSKYVLVEALKGSRRAKVSGCI